MKKRRCFSLPPALRNTWSAFDQSKSQPHASVYKLFDDCPFAGLLIFEYHMVGERRSRLGIGLELTRGAPIDKCFRIEVCANSDIAHTLNLFALPSNKNSPVFKSGGHIFGIGKNCKRPSVCMLVLEPNNSYDIVHSDISFYLSENPSPHPTNLFENERVSHRYAPFSANWLQPLVRPPFITRIIIYSQVYASIIF